VLFLWLIIFCDQAETEPLKSIAGDRSMAQPVLPDYLPDKENNDFTLPSIPEIRRIVPTGPVFILSGAAFEGNTIFSTSDLKQVAAPFLNREISMADLEQLRYQLTRYYVDQGYPNSGAIIKSGQTIDDGVITFTIVEGRLNEISMVGNTRLRSNYILKRIWPDSKAVFNIHELQDRFQILLQDPLIKQMKGEIQPGIRPGEALLDLDITREKPYELSIAVDNHSPPSLGSEHLFLNGIIRNLTGFGDSLDLSLGLTQGTREMGASFSIPLSHRNTLLTMGYNRNENTVIEELLDDIDVKSELESVRVSLMHPVYQSLHRKFDLGVALETKESRTSLLDIPFSFSEGYENGKSKVSVSRLIQSFEDRSLTHAFVIRSTFSFGLNLFDATIHSDDKPDGEFISWMGQFQYAHRFNEKLGQIIFKGNIQFANDNLLSMEQFSLGGASTVRGYRENEIVSDNGVALSLDWRIPVWKGQALKGEPRMLQVAPFIDYGAGWNNGDDSNDTRLFSTGLGLLWTSPRVSAELYMAHGFDDIASKAENNLQDNGIHFKVTIKFF